MNEKQDTNGDLTVTNPSLDGITSAVTFEIRRAEARAGNFNSGWPTAGDTTATDYFDTLHAHLEAELDKVRVARSDVMENV